MKKRFAIGVRTGTEYNQVSYADVYPPEAIEFFKNYHNQDNILRTLLLDIQSWLNPTG